MRLLIRSLAFGVLIACGGAQPATPNNRVSPAATPQPTMRSTYPSECSEYARIAKVAKRCVKLSQKMRDEVGVMPDWLELDGDEQAAMPTLCASLVAKTRTAMTAVGC